MGILLEAGAVAKNLTESQFGIASVKHRWNLSGTFQQCLPRYISAEQDGSHEREFLNDYFDTPGQLLTAIFLKGYQWPFDPRKVEEQGSSLIDLLVYQETVLKGRQVFLDFMHNPSPMMEGGNISFRYLTGEAREYLENSRALLDLSLIHILIWSDSKRRQPMDERIPAGRWGNPDDFEGAAVFLASRASDYICLLYTSRCV